MQGPSHVRDIPDDVSGDPETWMVDDGEGVLPQYVQIAVFLRRLIVRGKYPLGSKLPSENDLAERYEVTRVTARRALALLARHGLTSPQRGVGHFVRSVPQRRVVLLEPGTRIDVRMRKASERTESLSVMMYVITEPGQPAVTYEASVTDLLVRA